jgi:hypothetical protein
MSHIRLQDINHRKWFEKVKMSGYNNKGLFLTPGLSPPPILHLTTALLSTTRRCYTNLQRQLCSCLLSLFSYHQAPALPLRLSLLQARDSALHPSSHRLNPPLPPFPHPLLRSARHQTHPPLPSAHCLALLCLRQVITHKIIFVAASCRKTPRLFIQLQPVADLRLPTRMHRATCVLFFALRQVPMAY